MGKPLIHRIYDIVLPPFRKRRMAKFDRMVMDRAPIESVIDLGGSEAIWALSKHEPQVTLVNLDDRVVTSMPNVVATVGDATKTGYEDDAFDLVFSNSVIEHVGEDRWEPFAQEVRRLAPASFVQTPAHWFPFEPHTLMLFLHWLPKNTQMRLLRNGSLWGLITRPSQDEVDDFVRSTTLLRKSDMQRLFPEHDIVVERFLGLPKAYVAVRLPPESSTK